MATSRDDTAAAANVNDTQIWGSEDRACRGKFTKRHYCLAGGIVGAVALVLGLSVGLSNSSGDSSDSIVGQAVDPNALGCYIDERRNRIMKDSMSDAELTPSICNDYCDNLGYYYYGLQWGVECWCASEDTDLNEFGDGTCDFDCAGDSTFNCGGYLSFAAYEVGVDAATPVSPTPSPVMDTNSSPASESSGSSTCDGDATIRLTTSTIYVEGGGCTTMTSLYNAIGDSSKVAVTDSSGSVSSGSPTGYWLLSMDLRINEDSLLEVHGTSSGGDCDYLRIKSDGSSDFYEIRGHGGSLSFKGTKVTSWDTDSGKEQTTYKNGRSFINCVSEVIDGESCAKNNMGECRMDIIDSVMGNMGWPDSESYGLTWKVRGFCTDKSNPEVFDTINVYGDIQGSEIYGMYYGMYSYGHQGGVWTDNVMRDNILYGFDPHDDSDYLTIADNTVYGNGNHGIIGSKRCNNLKIYNNEVYDGGSSAVGIFLHRSTDDAEVYNNVIYNMQDAGIAIMESMDADIHDNSIEDVKYGLRISLGGSGNQIYDNVFNKCSSYGFYTYEGSDEPDVSNGRPSNNVFTNNIVSNTEGGLKLKDGDGNQFIDNTFVDAKVFEFDAGDTKWTGNSIGSACYKGSPDFTSDSDSVPKC